jgi:dTDP-4-amino-4,6-dideoxy-D-galactose acyltransferase
MESLESALESRKKILELYSPYNFLPELNKQLHENHFVTEKFSSYSQSEPHFIFEASIHNSSYFFLYSFLDWDSKYFQIPVYKLYTVLYTSKDSVGLIKAIEQFISQCILSEKSYFFIEIPSEDILLIQCLGVNGFKLVENRMNYYHDKLNEYSYHRFNVREASLSDASILKSTAIGMRNDFDRFHADFSFSDQIADKYLGTYIENCVRGFADKVIMPAEPGIPSESFLAISYLTEDASKLGLILSRVALTAVSPINKGWHLKLVSETIYDAKERNASYVLMTTQSTNRAVFRTCEKLGFKLGSVTHILTYRNEQ